MKKRKFLGSEAANGLLMISPTAIYSIVVMAAPLIAVLLFSFMYVLVNLGVDLLYTLFDPRIRY